MEKFKKFVQSKIFIKVIKIIGVIIIISFIFEFGMFVGFKKASFSFRNGESYFRQMQGRPNDPMMGIRGGDFTNSHGTVGKIIKISLPDLVIEDRDNTEKIILIDDETILNNGGRRDIKVEDLKEGEVVMVIGTPNEKNQIEAKLIRVLPPAPENIKNISTTTLIKK